MNKTIIKWIEDNLTPLGIFNSEFNLITNGFDGKLITGVIIAKNGQKFPFKMEKNSIYHEDSVFCVIINARKNISEEEENKEMKKIMDDVDNFFEYQDELYEKLFIEGYHSLKDKGIKALHEYIKKNDWDIFKQGKIVNNNGKILKSNN